MNKEPYHVVIPPSTGQIYGMIHAGSMSLKITIAELVANAIDQDAKNIDIDLDKKKATLTISDDGHGCAKLETMVEIGTHLSSKEDTIGKYGVGFKDAVIWLGDSVTIDSKTKSGKKQSVFADWQNMMALHYWDFAFVHDSSRTTPGVTITVSDLRKRRFKSNIWNDVPKYIAELFSAAIDIGITIRVDGVIVKSNPQPLLTNVANFKGSFGGLEFEGVAGILVDKKSAPSGWEIRYGPQTVQLGYLKEGFGTYSPQGFYGRFHMINGDRKWTISRNKTDSEDLYDVLNCEYMQSVIKPILEQIKRSAEQIKVRMNQVKAEICLTNLLQRAKVRITEEDEPCGPGGKGPGRRSGPTPAPDKPLDKIRKKRIYDPLGDVKDRIKKAQVLKIWPHQDIKNKGFCYLNASERETIIAIYIDETSKMGQLAWVNHSMLIQYAVMCLAVYFGLKVNILGQLQLPIGDLGASNEIKISKALLYLLENIDMDEAGNTIIAA